MKKNSKETCKPKIVLSVYAMLVQEANNKLSKKTTLTLKKLRKAYSSVSKVKDIPTYYLDNKGLHKLNAPRTSKHNRMDSK